MSAKAIAPDGEFEAIKVIYTALEPLDDEARARVITYIISRFDVAPKVEGEEGIEGSNINRILPETQGSEVRYSTFAELFDAAHQPQSASNKALLAGYWLQVCEGQGDFDSQSANKELKNLGEGIVNITIAMNSLKSQKPALAIQLRKAGKSQQARKTYKITVAGMSAVESMIKG
jgi:hypothetical protein